MADPSSAEQAWLDIDLIKHNQQTEGDKLDKQLKKI